MSEPKGRAAPPGARSEERSTSKGGAVKGNGEVRKLYAEAPAGSG